MYEVQLPRGRLNREAEPALNEAPRGYQVIEAVLMHCNNIYTALIPACACCIAQIVWSHCHSELLISTGDWTNQRSACITHVSRTSWRASDELPYIALYELGSDQVIFISLRKPVLVYALKCPNLHPVCNKHFVLAICILLLRGALQVFPRKRFHSHLQDISKINSISIPVKVPNRPSQVNEDKLSCSYRWPLITGPD